MTANPKTANAEAQKDVHDHQQVQVIINNKHYTTPNNPLTVAELKTLAGLPLDFNCYRIIHGKSEGPLANGEVLDLKNGDRFTINRGEDPS
ncbi:MAG: hypothetical protein ACYC64_00030 [Armatimonadota bacterium]